MLRTLKSRLAATTVVAAVAGTLLTVGPSAEAAVPDTIPFKITNNSARGETLYIYNLGTQLSSGRQGWGDANGTFHAWPGGAEPPVPAPDAAIVGPAPGQSATIRLPKFSGRVYFSYGKKINFRLATGGLVQPAMQNPTDPNINTLFNWSEYTLNNDGLWINSTQVDMFSAPYTVGVKRANGTTLTAGALKPGGYQNFFNSLQAQGGGWEKLIQRAPNGTILRAIAPLYGVETGKLSPSLLDDYINRVWQKYRTTTLTVTPFADNPSVKYYGRVSGDVMNFTNSSGAVVTSFVKPDSASVFGCFNKLDAPNDLVRGPISRTLCSGFNRTNLLTNTNQPDVSAASFYKEPVTNIYSKKVHEQMVDGKAYGFAFDDVGHHESLVHDGSPIEASMTVQPLN
ncbi:MULTISPECIES: glycoside hydrolase family 64 protein [unclassified Streptomyces]|uniref:glycoside hydrolase family 64 protein n=1 Tax=unclassified Streptomyces TaxID=2593676 RepID=UPI003824CD63